MLKWNERRSDRTAMNYYRLNSKEKKKILLMIDSMLESLFFRLQRSVIKTIIYLQIFNYSRLLRSLKNNISLSHFKVQCKSDAQEARTVQTSSTIFLLSVDLMTLPFKKSIYSTSKFHLSISNENLLNFTACDYSMGAQRNSVLTVFFRNLII